MGNVVTGLSLPSWVIFAVGVVLYIILSIFLAVFSVVIPISNYLVVAMGWN